MRKKYLPLTKEQKERGVIFSSELVGGGIVHEITEDMSIREQERKKRLLLDDSFFNNSPYKYNLIRE